jgi:uncharacterized protein (TIGR02246 family)
MNRVQSVLTVLLACFVVSCAPSSEKTASDDDTAAANKVRDEFTAAFNAGDAAKVASLYASDAVLMPPHEPVITGHDAIEKHNKELFDMFTATIKISSGESKVFGDRALDRGTYTIELTPKTGGSSMMDEGKYLVLLQRQSDGSWKITHDIDNTNVPAAPPPPAPAAPAKGK